MTDRELLELLVDKFTSMEEIIKELQEGQKELKEGQKELHNKIDTFKAQFEEHEAKDVNRHIEMMKEIKDLRRDLAAVETITAKNWSDIANLKAVK